MDLFFEYFTLKVLSLSLQPEKPSFEFDKIYRGVVEDNVDPLDAGRVRVRIFGIHDFNGKVTPIDELPWAEPALNLYWSGGHNLTNKDHEKTSPDIPGERYDPGSLARIPSKEVEEKKANRLEKLKNKIKSDNSDDQFQPETEDDLSNSCGTGGQFVVPKRGNWVFLFFEAGNHMNPIYFAMATVARDWKSQKNHREKEITDKTMKQFLDEKEEWNKKFDEQKKQWEKSVEEEKKKLSDLKKLFEEKINSLDSAIKEISLNIKKI